MDLIIPGVKALASVLARGEVARFKDKKLGSAFEAEVYGIVDLAWRSATESVCPDGANLDELAVFVAHSLSLDGAGEALLTSTFDESRPFDFTNHPKAAANFEEGIAAEQLGADPIELLRAFRGELRRVGQESASRPGSTLANMRTAGGLETIEALVRQWQPAPPAGPTLPVRFNLPRVTAHFSGRGPELAALQKALQAGGKAVITQTISGLGGVGKSQLAARFLRDHLEECDIVAWIRSEVSPVADLAELATELALGTQGAGEVTPEELATGAKRFLERTEHRWLVVFDNVDDPAQLSEWAPVAGPGRVLVTSRRRDFTEFGGVLSVDVFDEQTGSAYLVDTAERPGELEDALELTRALGGLPLALSHAAAYCGPGTTFSEYLGLLKDLPAGRLFKTNSEASYRQTVASTWEVSVTAAAAESEYAPRVLAMAAYLAPEEIPRGLFEHLIGSDKPAERTVALREALACLAKYSLVTLTDEAISVHRLLQKVVRDADAQQERIGALAALAALEKAFPGAPDAPANWPQCQVLLPHVVALMEADPRSDRAERVFGLSAHLVQFLSSSGQIARTITLAEGALEFAERTLPSDHPHTITARGNLALSYQPAGRTAEAISIQEQVVADRLRILNPDNPDTISARNNLASFYLSAQRTAEALMIFEEVLADRERILGPDHRDTIRARSNLASALDLEGRAAEAIEIKEQVVADYARILGTDDPDTITVRNNLAFSYHSADRTAEAIPIHEEVVASRDRILGTDHPDTIAARYNLAYSYYSAGRGAEAIPIYEQVVIDAQTILGTDHPLTIKARNNLASSYHTAGRTAEAIPIQKKVVADRDRILGTDHSDTTAARDNLERIRGKSV